MRTRSSTAERSTAGDVVRHIVRETLAFDRRGVAPGQGLRVAAGTVTAFALGWAGWSYPVGAAAAGGSMAPGVASLGTGHGPRLGVVASTAVGMVLATFVGSATARVAWLHVAVAAGWAVVAGMVAAVTTDLAPVGMNSLVALLVFGRFPASPTDALRTAAAVGAGALLQTLLAAVGWRPHRTRQEVQALAAAYGALAVHATSLARGASSLDAAPIDAAATALARSRAEGTTREAWDTLVDEAARIRLELLSIAGARTRAVRTRPDDPLVPRLDAALQRAGRLLSGVATALAAGRLGPAAAGTAVGSGRMASLLVDGRPQPGDADADAARAALEALAGQLRAVTAQLPAALGSARGRIPRSSLAGRAGDTLATLRTLGRRLRADATWQGSAVRHALRLAAAVLLAELIGLVTGLARPYWIAVIAVLVLRPDFASTFTRGATYALGTLAGVGLATAAAIALPPRHVVVVLLVGLFAWLAVTVFGASFALFSAAVTGVVVFLLAGVDPSPVADAIDRLLAAALGAGLALGLYAAWPSWVLPEARMALAAACDAQGAYLDEVLGQVAGARARRRDRLDALDRERRRARGAAEAAVARSLTDPPVRRIDERMARGVLPALRRQVIAAHALRTRLLTQDTITVPEVLPLAAAVGATLAGASARLRGIPAGPPPGLRSLHDELVDRLRGRPLDAEARTLVEAETDEIVDAAGTLTHLLGSSAGA